MGNSKDFKYVRWSGKLHLYMQVVLFVGLFIGLSMLATRHFQRSDLTSHHRYSLSPETVAYMQQLDRSVKIYVTISSDPEDDDVEALFRDVRNLLREYEYTARRASGHELDIEFVNVYQQRGKARLLAENYGISESKLILLTSGDRTRIIFPNDLYQTEGGKRKKFLGEQVVTSAILDVASDQQKKLYFIGGHGEMRFDDVHPTRGLSKLGDALRQRNFKLERLDLSRSTRIPEDANMLLLMSPESPLLPHEEEMLRQYMADDAGRMLIMIDPGRPHGLDELFWEWGVLADDVVLLDTGPDFLASGGDLLLRRFGDHAIARSLIDNQIGVLAGLCRSVRPDPGRQISDSLKVQPLIGTSESSWGERSYSRGGNMQKDPAVDLSGPLSIAVVSERQVTDLPINIPGGRMVVFGTSDFVTNNRIGALGNLTLFLNAINWATDRDNLVNIPPRQVEELQIVLSREETNKLRFSLLALFPGMAALSGVIVYWVRRK